MARALIKMAYRQVMDAATQNNFEKNVLQFSYEEYKMKSQAYNPEGEIQDFFLITRKVRKWLNGLINSRI